MTVASTTILLSLVVVTPPDIHIKGNDQDQQDGKRDINDQ
jgi:hypothetical protein